MTVFYLGIISVISNIVYSIEKAIVRSTEPKAINSLENVENAFGN